MQNQAEVPVVQVVVQAEVQAEALKKIPISGYFYMAQEQGFEPWHRVTDLQAFQACPFNRLGIPARSHF